MDTAQRAWLHIWAAILWVLDFTIVVLRSTRKDERTVKATRRTTWRKGLKNKLMRRQSNTCS